MRKLRTLVIDALAASALKHLREVCDVEVLLDAPSGQIADVLGSFELLILRSGYIVSDDWLTKAKRLRGIIRAGVGMDNIPVEKVLAMGIRLANIPTASTQSVAEYAVGAILVVLRNILPAYSSLMRGEWRKNELIGRELSGKTVGLVGFGNIGRRISQLLASFDVEILIHRLSPEAKICDGPIFRQVSLAEICRQCDVISVQVPLTPSTRQLFGRIQFDLMSRCPFLINVSRLDVVDMAELRRAVLAQRVAGAVIDPIEFGAFNVDYFTNVPIFPLPHLGGSTFESQERLGREIKYTIESWALNYDLGK